MHSRDGSTFRVIDGSSFKPEKNTIHEIHETHEISCIAVTLLAVGLREV